MLAAFSDEAEKTAARMIVFWMIFKMSRKLIDSFSQNSYLDFGRTGVLSVNSELRHYFFFSFWCCWSGLWSFSRLCSFGGSLFLCCTGSHMVSLFKRRLVYKV